jgi:hypothetical protein
VAGIVELVPNRDPSSARSRNINARCASTCGTCAITTNDTRIYSLEVITIEVNAAHEHLAEADHKLTSIRPTTLAGWKALADYAKSPNVEARVRRRCREMMIDVLGAVP